MSVKYHINPRFRAYGKARLDVTLRAKDEQEWQEMWREPINSFPFNFSTGWKFGFEYKVDDFAAEVGFFIDVLGFSVRAFSPRYAQFASPGEELIFSVLEAGEGEESTPADTIRLYLKISAGEETINELCSRGITFEKAALNDQSNECVFTGFFRTPHGIRIDLWDQFPLLQKFAAEEENFEQYDDEDITDDEALDDSEALDDGDADETDRLINSLLGLAEEYPLLDENPGASDTEEDDDTAEEDFEDADDEESGEELVGSALNEEGLTSANVDPLEPSTDNWKTVERSSQTGLSRPHLPARISRSRGNNWPTGDDRRNGELSYEEIEDEY